TAELQWLHGTAGEVFLLAASGTGAMEAAVVNLMGPADQALVLVAGKFGERWQKLLEAYRLPHRVRAIEWGRSAGPADLEAALDEDPAITTVFATHSETSTGALHDLQG